MRRPAKMRSIGAAMALALTLTTACTKSCGDEPMIVVTDPPARVEIYVVDETTRVLADVAKDAPFPALPDGTDVQIPREHEAALARFASTVAAPAGFRIVVGARSSADSFSRTFLLATPPIVDGAHVARVLVAANGARVPGFALDDAGRAALDAVDGKRVAIVVDDRVVASSYRPTFGILPATTSAKK